MKPLILTMSAFGPFAATEVIDFTHLGEAPLFLINGPTGAGKTCILDAMCFALYGKTTGDEREPQQMRCDSADVDCLTEVTFEFELATKHYRIRRVPEQTTPKKRGDGVTKKHPEAQLFELGSGGEENLLVERKVSDATAEIESRTGLNVDQFRQVMVLPQGQFRQLLMATSAEREKIFSQLFQTHAYQKIELALKEQAKGIQGKVESHRSNRASILRAVEMDSDQALSDAIDVLKDNVALATQAKDAAQTVQQHCRKQLDAGKLLIDDYKNLATLESEAEVLNTRQNVIADHRIIVEMAEQALVFKPVIANITERQEELSLATKSYDAIQQRLQAAQQALSGSREQQKQLPQLKESLSEKTKRLHYLNGLGERLQTWSGLSDALTQASQQEKIAQEGLQRLQQKLSKFKQELSALDERLPLAQQELGVLDGVRQQQQDCQRMLEVYSQWQHSENELQKNQESLKQQEELGKSQSEQEKDFKRSYMRIEMQWHQGQAAVLANTLNVNEPCPVCGSNEHPSPTKSDVAIPSYDELKHAKKAWEEQDAILKGTRERYSGLKARVDELAKNSANFASQLSKNQSKAELETQLQNINHQLTTVDVLKEELAKGTARQKECRESLGRFEQRIAKAQDALNAAVSEQATIKGQQQQLEQELPEEFRTQDKLDQEIEIVSVALQNKEQLIEQIQQSLQAAQQEDQAASESVQTALLRLQETKDKAAQVQNDFDELLAQSSFDTQTEIQQHILPSERLQKFKQDIEAHIQKVQENAALIKQLKEKLKSTEAPDLIALEQALKESVEVYQSAEKEWQVLSGNLAQLESTVKAIAEIDQESKTLEQEYSVIGTLSDVANGQTGDKISLQRFVLSVLLDDVLLAAGERLQIMSKGRYVLLRKQVKAKGNKASGLELEVEDSYTSKTRAVSTLSGGESFMAALSMALGLSDVVQAYAGGIKLDTLFIDEGFGSLDQESLDLAVRTLIDLQSSGRMVGVISHVSELKEQIGIRLDVLKGVDGSRTSLIVP